MFDPDGFLVDVNCDPSAFIRRAKELDYGFTWEEDAFDMLIARRDAARRERIISEKYARSDFKGLLHTTLHPYQVEGVKFAFTGGRTINADEMGLGKTVQAIATAELLKKEGMVSSVIIICPTSLKYQWLSEIRKFTDSTALVVEGDLMRRNEQFQSADYFYKICSYHAISNNVKAGYAPSADMIIYDELQRLKNRDTQMGRQLRNLRSEYVMALSGTPLENKLEELYSVVQFVDQFLLGPLYEFTDLTTVKEDTGRVVGYKNLHKVSEMLRHTLLRRRKADVKLQMPSRTDTNMYVPMTKEQRAMHEEYKLHVATLIHKWKRFKFLSEADRKRLLLMLSMMRMVCDSTFIIDQKSRYDTKIDEIKEIVASVRESGGKVVVFSQWERMLRILSQELEKEDTDFCFLHGGVPSAKRKNLIDRFRDDPDCTVFLSTDAGATGLNLQSASLLINVDLPWNPAVLEQRIARIYRLGQENPVQIINMISRDTIEQRMLATLDFKSNLSAGILDGGEDAVFIESTKFNQIIDVVDGIVSDNAPDEATPQEAVTQEAAPDAHAQEAAPVNAAPTPQDTSAQESAPASPAPSHAAASAPAAHSPSQEAIPEAHAARPKSPGATPASPAEMKEFVADGMNFLGTLANILRQPEGAKNLADALVKEDAATGQTSINIPVPDKNTIINLFSAFATLINRGS